MFDTLTPAVMGSRSPKSRQSTGQQTADEMAAVALTQGPSAQSVALLTQLPRKQLTDGGRLDYIRAWEQVSSWALAQQLPAIVEHVGAEPLTGTANNRSDNLAFLEQQAAIEEARLTLALSPPAINDRVEVAQQLCGPMHQTLAELTNGRMTYQHAVAAVDAVRVLDPQKIAEVGQIEARAIAQAGHKPVGDFRRALRSAVDITDPTATIRRHRRAKRERRVRRWPLPDGMACLSVEAPGPDIEMVYGALSVLAGRPAPDDDRSIDARRCDAILAVCMAAVAPEPSPTAHQAETTPGPLRARPKVPVQAHVVIDVATLLGLADNNCVLSGYGEIPAGLAREWLHEATTWRRLVTDPVGGHLLDFGPVVRIAPEKLRGFLGARHQSCTFPSCNRRASMADMDHQPAWLPDGRGGDASSGQMRPLCRRHHNLKTFAGWNRRTHIPGEPTPVGASQDDGWTFWRGPSGRQWSVPPLAILDDD